MDEINQEAIADLQGSSFRFVQIKKQLYMRKGV